MSSRIAQADQLVADLEAAFTDTAGVVVTRDTHRAYATASRPGGAAVLVTPPSIRWRTWHIWEARYDLAVIAGPATDPVAAWEILDAMLDRIAAAGINVDTAEPATFKGAQPGAPLPAYSIRLHPLDD